MSYEYKNPDAVSIWKVLWFVIAAQIVLFYFGWLFISLLCWAISGDPGIDTTR